MTFLQFAKKVLEKSTQPLTPQEIWDSPVGIALRKDFKPAGKTPVASLGACLYTNCKKRNSIILSTGNNPARFMLKKDSSEPFSLDEQNEQDSEASLFPLSQRPGFSFTDCAQKVLESSANNQPMHYREIPQKALENGWLVTNGRTPESTMYAQIISEIQRRKKKGELPRFVQCGEGMVSLSRWQKTGLNVQIDTHNKKIAKALKEKLLKLEWGDFELLVVKLLVNMGFDDVSHTRFSNDGGIDARGTMVTGNVVRTKMVVQAKRWKANVQAPLIRQLRGSLGAHEQGLFITTSNFSKGAYEEAKTIDKTPIALMNGDQLVSLLMEYGIGVKKTDTTIFEIDEENGFLV